MASSVFVNAKEPKTSSKVERQGVKIALNLNVYFDGERADTTSSGDSGCKWLKQEIPNKEARKADSSFEIREEDLYINTPVYEDHHGFIRAVQRVTTEAKNVVQSYLMNGNVAELEIHAFLFCKNTGDIVSHLFSSDGKKDYTVNKKIETIKTLLDNVDIPVNNKLTYCKIDYIGIYDKVVGDRAADIERGENKNREGLSAEDVEDAYILCQYTYDMQTPMEQSFPNFVADVYSKWKGNKEIQKNEQTVNVPEAFAKTRYREITEEELVDLGLKGRLVNLRNGFYSKLFVKEKSANSRKKYAYCTCGTNKLSVQDWFTTNILQGLTGLSGQYTQSVQNAQLLDEVVRNDELIFVGHSLGGGLASNNAIVTSKRHAITFNAAGLSPFRLAVTGKSTLKDQIVALWNWKTNLTRNREEANARVHAFVIEGEVLNSVLSFIGEEAVGEITTIKLNKDLSALQKHGLMNFLDDQEVYKQIEESFGKI